MTILTFSLGVTGINGIRSEYMRGTDQVEEVGDKVGEVKWRCLQMP